MSQRRSAQQQIPKVGSRVRFVLAGREVVATVIENRGPFADGRSILRVRLDISDSDPIEFDIPAAEVKIAA